MTATALTARTPGDGRPGPQDLIVIGCGARKAARPAAAADLYTGSYFRACLAAALAIAPRDRILIISALHGLVGLDDGPIAPYEQTLGHPGAVTPALVQDQATARGLADATVVALCGARYVSLLRQIWTDVTTPLTGLGIGAQLHVLAGMRAGRTPTAGYQER